MGITGLKQEYLIKTGQNRPVQNVFRQREMMIKKEQSVLNGTYFRRVTLSQ